MSLAPRRNAIHLAIINVGIAGGFYHHHSESKFGWGVGFVVVAKHLFLYLDKDVIGILGDASHDPEKLERHKDSLCRCPHHIA